MSFKTPTQQWELIRKGAAEIIPEEELLEKLERSYKENRPLTVKAGFERPCMNAVPRGYADKVKSEFTPQPRLMAPIQAGQQLGSLKVTIDGKLYGEYPVPALENVGLIGIFGRTIDSVLLWFE